MVHEDPESPRATVPAPLVLAIALAMIRVMVSGALALAGGAVGERWSLISVGLTAVIGVLLATGAAELAASHRGWTRRALLAVSVAAGAQLAIQALSLTRLWFADGSWMEVEARLAPLRAAWYIVDLAVGLSFVAAVASLGHRAMALGCLAVAICGSVPPWIWRFVSPELTTVVLVTSAVPLIQLVMIAVILPRLAALPTASPATISRGLRRAAAALHWRAVALAIGSGSVALVAVTRGRGRFAGALQIAVVAGSALGAAAIAGAGLGLLGAARAAPRDLSRRRLVVAAAALLWSGAVAGVGALRLFAIWYGPRSLGAFGDETFSFVGPLMAALGISLALGAFAATAAGRETEALRQAVFDRRVIAALLVAGAALEAWAVPYAVEHWGGMALLTCSIVALGVQLSAFAMAARSFALVAHELAGDAALPAARVVLPGVPR